jgi:hypothetical protein
MPTSFFRRRIVWVATDDPVEHASRGRLRVPENAAVELHVLRVAADVGDQDGSLSG